MHGMMRQVMSSASWPLSGDAVALERDAGTGTKHASERQYGSFPQ